MKREMIVDKALRVGGPHDYHMMLKYDNITVASYILKENEKKGVKRI